jgi:signal transduction histidine kinase
MDYFMYEGKWLLFLKVRICSVMLVLLIWAWFRSPMGRSHYRIFGVTWYLSPLVIILWMIYAANDPASPYYAGLNIVLLAVGLISPWTYIQNLLSTLFVLAMYVLVCFAMVRPQPISIIINNTTFLALTAALVVSGSVANARQRRREFSLRWELDKNRRVVEESNRKLMEMDQIKSRFFANISHELRTPLTLMISPLETLIHRFGKTFDDETRGMLLTMQTNGMRLLKLINDLLELVRLDSGVMQVKREALDVGEFLRGLVSAARQLAQDKRVRLESSITPEVGTVMLDRDKLEKIILNLQFNALKFTQSGGRVDLRARKEGDELVIEVIFPTK